MRLFAERLLPLLLLLIEIEGRNRGVDKNKLNNQESRFDFAPIEKDLGIDCFTTITNYKSLPKKEQMYNQNVSEKVRDISDRVSEAESVDEIFAIMTAFYKQYGVGMFGQGISYPP